MHRIRCRIATSLAAAALALSGTWGAGPASADQEADSAATEYVALGDSFAAGPLILPQVQLDPCFRSAVDYPHVLAQRLHAVRFRDVTCSSATTENILSTPQPAGSPGGAAQPIQLDALTPSTDLVTVTIGANDIGLAGLAASCFNVLPDPAATSCRDTQTRGGAHQGAAKVDSVAVKLASTVDGIRDRAPHARIVMTSYANYIRPGGCYPAQPILPRDATYIQGLVNRLGDVTRRVAGERGAEYVDFIRPGQSHDGCNPVANWANVLVPGTTLGLVPLHPTALGEANFGRILAEHLAHRS